MRPLANSHSPVCGGLVQRGNAFHYLILLNELGLRFSVTRQWMGMEVSLLPGAALKPGMRRTEEHSTRIRRVVEEASSIVQGGLSAAASNPSPNDRTAA